MEELYVGMPVIYADPVAGQHNALITAVWGDPKTRPCINVVLVSADESKTDSYGRQIERQTSLQYKDIVGVHGMYYMLPGEVPNPIVKPTLR
jgi:hypothetical protein